MGHRRTAREIIHCIYRVRGLRKAELKWLGYPAVCFMMWRFPHPSTYMIHTWTVGGCLVWGYLFAAHCFWAVCAVYNYASSFNTRVARGARSSTVAPHGRMAPTTLTALGWGS